MANLRLGLLGLSMYSEKGFRNAGVSRCGQEITDQVIRRTGAEDRVVLMLGDDFEVPDRWRQPHVTIYRANTDRRGVRAHREIFESMRVAKLYGLNVVYGLFPAIPYFPVAKRVAMMHDIFPITHPELYEDRSRRIMAWSMRRCAKHADALFTISDFCKQEIVSNLGVDPAKITTVHLGLGNQISGEPQSFARPNELLDSLGVGSSPYIAALSTIEPRKNLSNLLRAIAEARKEGGLQGVQVVVCGAKGWKESTLGQTIVDLGLQDVVRFPGYVSTEDLAGLMANCEFFVHPALSEGFGIPVLEALRYGAPVVCSSTGSLPEVGGDLALYFDPLDPKDIARALVAGIERRDDRAFLVAKGAERAKTFTWDRVGEQTMSVLRSLV